jgi:hypothetical protein
MWFSPSKMFFFGFFCKQTWVFIFLRLTNSTSIKPQMNKLWSWVDQPCLIIPVQNMKFCNFLFDPDRRYKWKLLCSSGDHSLAVFLWKGIINFRSLDFHLQNLNDLDYFLRNFKIYKISSIVTFTLTKLCTKIKPGWNQTVMRPYFNKFSQIISNTQK